MQFYMPTKVISGEGCVKNNPTLFALGKRAIIVTGKTSAKKSGALYDVCEVLDSQGIAYAIFDKVENNPSIENMNEAGFYARAFDCDFVIGIGGGSPLDAAKAVAVLAATGGMEAAQLFEGAFPSSVLPLIAIPTTAGTGSEVTPYSILTVKKLKTKKSFSSDQLFPRYAFLDWCYTKDLPYSITVHTAIDALCHAIEGYLSKRATAFSSGMAKEAISLFGTCRKNLENGKLDAKTRKQLLTMSTLAGMVIAQTGTTIVHSMGYGLTYFYDVPHGLANGLLLYETLKFNKPSCGGKLKEIIALMGLSNMAEFKKMLKSMLSCDVAFTEKDIQQFAKISIQAKNNANNPKPVTLEDELEIYRNSLL